MLHMFMSVPLYICIHIVIVSSSVKYLMLECVVFAQFALEANPD